MAACWKAGGVKNVKRVIRQLPGYNGLCGADSCDVGVTSSFPNRGTCLASSSSDNSPVRRLPDWVTMTKKSKVPLGTTEPCLFGGAPFVPERDLSILVTRGSPALKRWAIFKGRNLKQIQTEFGNEKKCELKRSNRDDSCSSLVSKIRIKIRSGSRTRGRRFITFSALHRQHELS
jgi:hypothetical protein